MTSSGSLKLAELPALEDVPPSERMRLFRQKLKLCCVLYDFRDMRKHVREKEAKRNALLQVVEYISASKVAWDPSVVAELLECVGVNIFRHLGRSLNASVINASGSVEGLSVCLSVCLCVCLCVSVCMYMCAYVWGERERRRWACGG